jgi:hypothetical protein
MSKTLSVALAAACLTFGAYGAAHAAGDGFCRDYARAAVNQVRGAMAHYRCDWRTDRDPARWSTDWRVHYDWCRGVSRDQASDEREARRNALEHCARGRDHDHDHDRDRDRD